MVHEFYRLDARRLPTVVMMCERNANIKREESGVNATRKCNSGARLLCEEEGGGCRVMKEA